MVVVGCKEVVVVGCSIVLVGWKLGTLHYRSPSRFGPYSAWGALQVPESIWMIVVLIGETVPMTIVVGVGGGGC